MLFNFTKRCAARKPSRSKGRRLVAEQLEARELLDAAGLVPIGTQPSGALDGKIVYLHGGHGIEATATGWGYQRPLLLDMVEDLGNQDQMSLTADELWRAGATVVPLRPIGNQVNEVVLDNDDVGVTFTGAWSNSSSSIYFGSAGDVPYRFASTSLVETATAQYRPNLPEGGFYPVYAWTRPGTDRAPDHLYRVHHAGGATEVTVNHRMVGNGLVYLGTYYFEAGTGGYVEISNRSSQTGRVVIADMIRFGNGMGSLNFGNGVSGEPRENELGLYWLQWHTQNSQGVPSSTHGTSSVSAPPRYAAYMNQAGVGSLSDRVFLSYHSNAGSGSSRGVLGLLNGNNRASAATPNQFLLADTVARQINDDLVAQAGAFEHNWFNRTVVTLDRSDIEFGEINNEVIGGEFDATIIETGFHDNTQDAQMLRDRRVREAIAKASVQGLIDYFDQLDATTPNIDPPSRIASLSVASQTPGEATLSWTAGAFGGAGGAAPTGYMVYASTNGLGFDGGRYVAGGATTSTTITGLTPGETYYFRVHAVNAGGEGPPSEVVAIKPAASAQRVLIVSGFDRQDRSLSEAEQFRNTSSTVDRVRLYGSNTRDYVTEVAGALEDAGVVAAIATASNEAVASGAVTLSDFDAVIWISGSESSADDTFNTVEQSRVAAYLAGGGKLFVSGAEIGWDLDQLNNGRSFYNGSLRADYVADDASTYAATGAAGSIFAGLAVTFDDGSVAYNVAFPDVITPLGGATAALTYSGGTGGTAGVQYANGATGERLVNLGFPFESILGAATRTAVMSRVAGYFGLTQHDVSAPLSGDFNADGVVNAADYTVWRDAEGQAVTPYSGADADGSGRVDAADINVWRATYGQVTATPPSLALVKAPEVASEPASDTVDVAPVAPRSLASTGLYLAADSGPTTFGRTDTTGAAIRRTAPPTRERFTESATDRALLLYLESTTAPTSRELPSDSCLASAASQERPVETYETTGAIGVSSTAGAVSRLDDGV